MNTTILQLLAISIEDKDIVNNNPPRQGTIQELKLLLHSYNTTYLQHMLFILCFLKSTKFAIDVTS